MKVVVSTPDVVGERMAGPGIRAKHFAAELAKHFDTTLIAKSEGGSGFVPRGTPEARDAIRAADVLVTQTARDLKHVRRGQRVVADLFDPVVIELRELYGNFPSMRQRIHLAAEWGRLLSLLRRADVLIAATEKQIDFYRKLQSTDTNWLVIPFGAEQSATRNPQPATLVWGGGQWEWLDPALAVDAIVALNREGFACHLLFMGRTRPNRDLIDRRREDRFEQLLARGGPFVSAMEWVPYRERLSWLCRGKATMMLHRPTAEAATSIRTRLFDAIAAAVPVIATREGFAAELVAAEGLGIVVPPSDVRAVMQAVRRLLLDDAFHARCVTNLERIRPHFAWEVVTRPLIEQLSQWERSRH
jgi:glycosyltransferase involved in cell wall biosynthesis